VGLTTIALTLTIAGLAVDSNLVGGDSPRGRNAPQPFLAMLIGATAGFRCSLIPLLHRFSFAGLMIAICALARLHLKRKELMNG